MTEVTRMRWLVFQDSLYPGASVWHLKLKKILLLCCFSMVFEALFYEGTRSCSIFEHKNSGAYCNAPASAYKSVPALFFVRSTVFCAHSKRNRFNLSKLSRTAATHSHIRHTHISHHSHHFPGPFDFFQPAK